MNFRLNTSTSFITLQQQPRTTPCIFAGICNCLAAWTTQPYCTYNHVIGRHTFQRHDRLMTKLTKVVQAYSLGNKWRPFGKNLGFSSSQKPKTSFCPVQAGTNHFLKELQKLAVIANMRHKRRTQTTISTCLNYLWKLGRPV